MDANDMYTDSKNKYILTPIVIGGFMGKLIDRTGQRFGKLVAIKEAGRDAHKKVMWECVCDCGKITKVNSGSLTTGNTKSCGCEEGYVKHRGSSKASYNTWRAMRRRCNNPKDKDYFKYGAVGIKVCSEWEDYLTFAKDMGEPVGNETLDRIDPNGNYEPSNCRWASCTTQARNIRIPKRNNTGVIGVQFKNNKWYGHIVHNRKKYYSKAYLTKEEAVAARKELERIHWNT
jgi:hypothetical protein